MRKIFYLIFSLAVSALVVSPDLLAVRMIDPLNEPHFLPEPPPSGDFPNYAWYVESFENGFGAWIIDDDGRARAVNAYITGKQYYDGVRSVGLMINGWNDDGTLWIERTVLVNPSRQYSVNINFWLWSERESDVNQWKVVSYAGTLSPEKEEDFALVGITDMSAGWVNYNYRANVMAGAEGQLHVAAGISCIWETTRTYYLDLVTVEVDEITSGSLDPRPKVFMIE